MESKSMNLPRCWAYGPEGKRCDLSAGHEELHSISLTWTDEECIDPTALRMKPAVTSPPVGTVSLNIGKPVPAFTEPIADEPEPVEWIEPDDEDDEVPVNLLVPPPPGAVIKHVQLPPTDEGEERPALAILAGSPIEMTRKGAAGPQGCYSCGCGPRDHQGEDGCQKHGCRAYVP